MAKAGKICINCEEQNLEWRKDPITGKFRLAYPGGLFHLCTTTQKRVDQYNAERKSKAFICRHGVKKGYACRECIQERYERSK